MSGRRVYDSKLLRRELARLMSDLYPFPVGSRVLHIRDGVIGTVKPWEISPKFRGKECVVVEFDDGVICECHKDRLRSLPPLEELARQAD